MSTPSFTDIAWRGRTFCSLDFGGKTIKALYGDEKWFWYMNAAVHALSAHFVALPVIWSAEEHDVLDIFQSSGVLLKQHYYMAAGGKVGHPEEMCSFYQVLLRKLLHTFRNTRLSTMHSNRIEILLTAFSKNLDLGKIVANWGVPFCPYDMGKTIDMEDSVEFTIRSWIGFKLNSEYTIRDNLRNANIESVVLHKLFRAIQSCPKDSTLIPSDLSQWIVKALVSAGGNFADMLLRSKLTVIEDQKLNPTVPIVREIPPLGREFDPSLPFAKFMNTVNRGDAPTPEDYNVTAAYLTGALAHNAQMSNLNSEKTQTLELLKKKDDEIQDLERRLQEMKQLADSFRVKLVTYRDQLDKVQDLNAISGLTSLRSEVPPGVDSDLPTALKRVRAPSDPVPNDKRVKLDKEPFNVGEIVLEAPRPYPNKNFFEMDGADSFDAAQIAVTHEDLLYRIPPDTKRLPSVTPVLKSEMYSQLHTTGRLSTRDAKIIISPTIRRVSYYGNAFAIKCDRLDAKSYFVDRELTANTSAWGRSTPAYQDGHGIVYAYIGYDEIKRCGHTVTFLTKTGRLRTNDEFYVRLNCSSSDHVKNNASLVFEFWKPDTGVRRLVLPLGYIYKEKKSVAHEYTVWRKVTGELKSDSTWDVVVQSCVEKGFLTQKEADDSKKMLPEAKNAILSADFYANFEVLARLVKERITMLGV